MRRVLTKHLKDGDVIAKDIVSSNGGILLRHNTRVKEVFKNKLIERNIYEVYIDDEVSRGIEPTEILTLEVKKKITSDVREQFKNLEDNIELDVEKLTSTVRFFIEEMSQKDMLLELEDIRINDEYTYEHCIAVAILTYMVCEKMNIPIDQKEAIVLGAMIHDIGKVIIPKDVLKKSGKLTNEEYEVIKEHAKIGYMMIKDNVALNAITKLVVLCHHEREDGTGYPLGKGKELHIGAKIVAACDIYHALISNRCYRQGLPIHEVIHMVQKEAVNNEVRSAIEQVFAYYPVGTSVCLSDGNIAIVEKNFTADIKRPIVRVVQKVDKKIVSAYKINLQEQKEFHIVGRYDGDL